MLKREFGDRLLTEITLHEILDYQQNFAGRLSNITANRSLFLIKQVFQHGMMVRSLTADPDEALLAVKPILTTSGRYIFPTEVSHKIGMKNST